MNETARGHEYLTVRELAELLRLKERKVYDLAASGAVPVYRATGKLLFPAAEIRAWIERSRDGAARGGPGTPAARPPIVLGSHDPLLDWAIRESRCALATSFDGSLDGLERFAAGDGVATGLHVRDGASERWNVPLVSRAAAQANAVLVRFATRRRGLVYRKDGPSPGGIASLEGLRVVPRQAGSGSDGLFRQLAASAGLELGEVRFTDVARTEDAAVERVRRGAADVAFGLEAMARAYALQFLPLLDEEFSLLIDRKAYFDEPFRTLLAFCEGEPFARRAGEYGGYDAAGLGAVLWNA